MGKKTAFGFYAVGKGRNVGIYQTWAECEANVKGYPDAKFKKFATETEAQAFVNQWSVRGVSQVTRAPLSLAFGNSTSAASSSQFSLLNQNTQQQPRFNQSRQHLCTRAPASKDEHLQNIIASSKRKYGQEEQGTRLLQTPPAKYTTKKLRTDSPQINKGITSLNGELVYLPFIVDEDEFVHVYTDGACLQNGQAHPRAGVGVWFGDDHPLNVSKPVDGPATNNTAEIQAARLAIDLAAKAGFSKLKINTDSAFLINCVTQWLPKWKSNGWKLAAGGDVKNRIELEKLDLAQRNITVYWKKVAAHSGIHGNEMADKLAGAGALM